MDNLFEFFASIEGLAAVPPSSGDMLPLLMTVGSGGETGRPSLPLFGVEGISFGLDKPIDSGATSAAIVGLLQQDHDELIQASARICAYDDNDDQRAISVVYFVSNLLTYVQDGSGIGDRWTGAVATWKRKYGDCEDGALLIHALLLAAGVDPGRVRTAMGLAMNTSLVEIGHAWVMYRRLTDEEWIPLEWTWQPSPYTIEASQINRQVDMASSYTKISYILTNEQFSQVADVNYIAHLAANRSSGSTTLPALTGQARTGVHGTGEVSLSSLAGVGLCGATAAASLPRPAGTSAAQQLATALGATTLAAITGDGTTGAVAAGILSSLSSSGQCGTSASGRANFPAITGYAAATVDALIRGAVILPELRATGRAFPGAVVDGSGTLAALLGVGRAKQGPAARGATALPRLSGAGFASVLLVGLGGIELPPMIGRGHAINGVAPWPEKLSYNPLRWT